MKPFNTHRGLIAAVDTANIDTDQIIAKQFLKSIKRTGFGEYLFHDWRFDSAGKPNPNFPLNQPRFQGASILLARNNFGCGSSREHAVWAIQQFGFTTVIAPWRKHREARIPAFADIFRNNCVKNGLLTVELSEAEGEKIFQSIAVTPGLEATVNLEKQEIRLHLPSEISFHFEVEPAVKNRLLLGLNDISITLQHEEAIRSFEEKHDTQIKP